MVVPWELVRSPQALFIAVLLSCAPRAGTPVLRSVEPAVFDALLGGPVELVGEGFFPAGALDFDQPTQSGLSAATSAELELAGQFVALTGVSWVDSTRIAGTVPPGLTPGSWTVHLVSPRGDQLVLSDALRVQARLPDGGWPDAGDDGGADAGDDAGFDAGDDAGFDAGEDAGFDAGPQPCQTLTFEDADEDGFGRPDSGALTCGPGRVELAGDCNDIDSLTSPAGTEICNGLDDDCDGMPDENCPDAGFTRVRDGGGALLSVSAWGPNQVWIAGAKLLVSADDGGFIDASNNCPMNLNAVWATPSGRAFVGGGNLGVGRLTTATRAGGCVNAELMPEPAAGLVGFVSADGGVRVEVVLRDGRRVSWDGVGPLQIRGAQVPSGIVLLDAHGSSPGTMYGVGGTTAAPQRPVVYRLEADGGLFREPLPANVPDGQLHGVWVVGPGELVAVGDRGLVLRRVHGAWELISPPSMVNYTTVRAFSIGRFYLSTEFGSLLQWSGSWALHSTDQVPVRDLTAFDEEHFWLVGDNGVIIHGP